MEYLKEINAFYDWVRSDARVKSSAISLWHGLMNIANKAGWPTEITVSISTLQSTTGMGKNSIYAARNILQQVGRIQFKERRGSQSAKYTIIPFAFEIRTQTGTQSGTQTVTQTGTQSGSQTGNIYRLDNTRLNKNNIPPLSPKGGEGKTKSSKSKNKKIYPSIEAQIVSYTDSGVLQNALEQFVAARKKMKKTLTEYAFYCLLRDLDRLAEKGYDKLSCVNMAVSRGWQGFYEPYKQKQIAKQEQKDGFINTLNGILKEEGEL
ncbi:MAG: hypothetical protein HFI72_07375 [Peptococcaceae bacterium]|nr:hypothetical protein [Peptococcaceae bacterium]